MKRRKKQPALGHYKRTAKRSARLAQEVVSQREAFKERLAARMTRGLIVLIFALAIGGLVVTAARDLELPWGGAGLSSPADELAGRRIGIISGHRGYDSGAICEDGLTEAEVNFLHATRVADLLRANGYLVDVLDEYDARLRGYRASAVVSIHADSCVRLNAQATGFKVVYPMTSQPSKHLAGCLTARYARRTGLGFHARSITRDMTAYHAFAKVAPQTPIVIIETGFLFLDRQLLVHYPEIVAQGIAEGILCFLRDESPET